MKTNQAASLVAARSGPDGKALPSMRLRPGRTAAAVSLLCGLLGLAACGQKGPLTLPPAQAASPAAPLSSAASAPPAASSPTR